MLLFRSLSLRCLSTSAPALARSTKTTMVKKSVYAVAVGRRPGLYRSWEECRQQVQGWKGNMYAGFTSEHEALSYLQSHGVGLNLAAVEPPAPPAAAAAAADADGAAAAAGAEPPPRKRRAPRAAGAQQASAAAVAARHAATTPPTDRCLRLEFDGASKRNPGPAGWGAVLYDEATGVEVSRMCQYMGDQHTNNQAEYAGLIAGLQAALELGCRRIQVQGDSTLIIRQVLGDWQVKNEGLRPYHAAATALMHRFASFQARQVRRELNQAADALSNQAIADYRSGANRQLWRIEDAAAAAAALDAEEEEEEGWEVEGWEEEGGSGGGGGGGAAAGAAADAAAGAAAGLEAAAAASTGGSKARPAKRARLG